MAAGTLTIVSFAEMNGIGGSSFDDTDTMYYFWWQNLQLWMNELHAQFQLDDSSITPVTGLTPGTYYNRWLLPKTLTSTYATVTECLLGPILATVVVASDGSIESITPTMKNGGYFAGETLRLMTDWLPEESDQTPAPSMGTPSQGVDVVVSVGSASGANICSSKYWGFPTTASWTSGKNTSVGFCDGRQGIETDALYVRTQRCGTNTATGTTTWYQYQYYTWAGWSTTAGRASVQGSYSGFNTTMSTTHNREDFYQWIFYRNSTPGSECFVHCDTYYNSPLGWYKQDTSGGHIGERLYSQYSLINNTTSGCMAYQASSTDSTYGYDVLGYDAGITRSGMFKPMRNAESDNFMVGGPNENLYVTGSTTPMLGKYSTSDNLVTFQKIGTYLAGRVPST